MGSAPKIHTTWAQAFIATLHTTCHWALHRRERHGSALAVDAPDMAVGHHPGGWMLGKFNSLVRGQNLHTLDSGLLGGWAGMTCASLRKQELHTQ